MPLVQTFAGQILDDVYVIEVSSPPAIQGVQVGIVAMVGTFQKGIPTGIYSISDYATAVRLLGKSTANIGGPIAIQNLLRQGCGNIQVVPCFGASAAAASINILDSQSTPGTLGTITAAQPHPQTGVLTPVMGIEPNSWIVAVTLPSTPNGTFNLTITTSNATETYTGLTPANWAAKINAASNVAIVSQPTTPSSNVAAVGTFAFAGGSCGTLTAGTALDSALSGQVNTDGSSTGLSLLKTITKNLLFAAEYTSSVINSALAAQATSDNCIAAICAPVGSTVAINQTTKALIAQDNVAFCDGWTVCYDSDTGTNRNCAPTSLIMGMVSQLAPQKSWGNKTIFGTQGLVTARNNPDMATLQQDGILCLSNSIPRGGFGTRSGVASDTSDLFVRRMRYFLEFSIMNAMGWAVDEVQSTQPNDPLRKNIKHSIEQFLNGLAYPTDPALKVIDSFLVTCDLTNNPIDQIAAGKLSVSVKVRLLSAAKQIIISADMSTGTITISSVAA